VGYTPIVQSPTKPVLPPKPVTIVSKLEPPKRILNYTEFDNALAEPWLKENLQSDWWKQENPKCQVPSKHQAAHFCEYWNQLLARASCNFIKLEQISTISEYCLVREICWMFVRPTTTKFFRMEGEKIRLHSNVSIPSVTVKGMRSFLKEFTEKMTIMHLLRHFCQKVHGNLLVKVNQPPHTVEAYAAELAKCLDKVTKVIIDKEKTIMQQFPGTVETVLELYNTLRPHLQFLEYLWFIHRSVILDWNKYSNHVCSSYLLAGLAIRIIKARNRDMAALTTALYLRSLKAYLEIVEIWWSEGRFEDWLQEFIVQPTRFPELNTAAYSPKFCHKEENRNQAVNAAKLKLIEKDKAVRILLQHSVTAGDTLNVLSKLDRMNEVKVLIKKSETGLYDNFLKTVLSRLEKFRTEPVQGPETPPEPVLDLMKASQISMMTESMASMELDLSARITEFRDEIQEMGNDLLLMSLQESLNMTEKEKEANPEPLLYDQLKNISSIVIPFHVIICRTLEELLDSKQRIAEELVLNLYRDEFQLASHLQNLRRVYLLEATVHMQSFFIPLFQDIEASKPWSNPYMLSVQLSHAMSPILADATNLFSVEVGPEFRCATTNVLEAVDEISIIYSVGEDMNNVIKPFDLERYNRVFRFLLKIKWAVWTLEQLQFPAAFKNRLPYAPITSLDYTMRRLIIVRTWISFYVNCIHSHMVHQVIINLDVQLNRYIEKAKNLRNIISAHQAFISLAYDNCFLNDTYIKLRENLSQLLKLVSVIRDEWNSVGQTMALDRTEEVDDLIESTNIGEIEKTYINLHDAFVKQLEIEVYKKGKRHLGELHAAFSSNMPV